MWNLWITFTVGTKEKKIEENIGLRFSPEIDVIQEGEGA